MTPPENQEIVALKAEIEQLREMLLKATGDASILSRFLMSAASDAHVFRRHQPYGSSFLDCDHTICQEHRAALRLPLHGRPVNTARPEEG